jgi:hypothetical protein
MWASVLCASASEYLSCLWLARKVENKVEKKVEKKSRINFSFRRV